MENCHFYIPGIKQMAPINFMETLKVTIQTPGSDNTIPERVKEVINELDTRRNAMAKSWAMNPVESKDTLTSGAWHQYVAVLRGLVFDVRASGSSSSSSSSTGVTTASSSGGNDSVTDTQEGSGAGGEGEEEGDRAVDKGGARDNQATSKAQGEEDSSKKADKNNTTTSTPSSSLGPPSRLQGCVNFYWTNIYGKERATSAWSSLFELASVFLTQVYWFKMKGAVGARQPVDPETIDVQERKVYNALLDAAALITTLQDDIVPAFPQEIRRAIPYDFHANVLKALWAQTIAEAQETTIARARRKSNSPALIARLARDNEKKFVEAMSLTQFLTAKELDMNKRAYMLQQYLLYKASFYQAMAYGYWGIHLNTDQPENLVETRGPGIACIQHCLKTYRDICLPATKAYIKALPKTYPRDPSPLQAVDVIIKFFVNEERKFERKNSIVAYSPIPSEPPSPPEPQSLVTAKTYTWPREMDRLWDGGIYESFNPSLQRVLREDGNGKKAGPPSSKKDGDCAVM